MSISPEQQQQLRRLPGVDRVLEWTQAEPDVSRYPKTVVLRSIREELDHQRHLILSGQNGPPLSEQAMTNRIIRRAARIQRLYLERTINATGVVVHTNLGRSCLADSVIDHLVTTATRYSNLEFDLSVGKRGSRHQVIENILCEISGAEAGLAVNNNAGAVLLALDTLARGKTVIISRGELVEIGGAFRIPDVMAKSGACLKEVGTTNRTHDRDYRNAIDDQTGLLLKVHTSNYGIVGFTKSVTLAELVDIGRPLGIPVMEDLGSGSFIDLSRYGLTREPTVQDSVAAGADVVTFSGDKLLGGPQAGLIVGRREMIDRIKQNPLARALRIDKMTLAALEATLRLYRDESQAVSTIPTLRMLTQSAGQIEHKSCRLADALTAAAGNRLHIEQRPSAAKAGGGALPLLELAGPCLALRLDGWSANALEKALRHQRPPIIGRIENDAFVLDPRTIAEDEIDLIVEAVNRLCQQPTDRESQ